MHRGAFRASGRVPQVFSILIEMLVAVLHCGTRVGRLPTRVTKQGPHFRRARAEGLLLSAAFFLFCHVQY